MAKSKPSEIAGDIASLSFEDALRELESIVGKLEAGNVDLEKSIEFYERGTQLKSHCEAKLNAAKSRVDKITLSADGSVSAEEIEIS